MISPVVVSMTRICRSWMSRMTWVRAWVRPIPMWWSLPAWRMVATPCASMLSERTRWWGLSWLVGRALARAAEAPAGVRPAKERCGRAVL
ncbi:hypothetical protein ASG23_01375 [Cellulomonas sp. Leaf395]|nr:hypothetical protein ASG23_01375 [Cellulomonas sp. Leaf395]